jgi:hypothetical protein
MRVIEYVTFTLIPGATEEAFLQVARATEALVRRQPGFVSRRLSRGEGADARPATCHAGGRPIADPGGGKLAGQALFPSCRHD